MQDLAGRIHPLVVHFPVALLLLAAGLLLVLRGREQHRLSPALALLVHLGALGALLAIGTGWVLADMEGFQGRTAVLLERHRQLGLAVGGLAVLASLLRLASAGRRGLRLASLGLSLLAALAVGGAGYLGAELVYGEGHLLQPSDEGAEPLPKIAKVDGKVDFRRDVQPVLRRSCHKCHGPRKQEGDLRLDLKDLAMQGGEGGVVIRPGDAANSELIRRITLPRDDEDYMPGKGRPLTEAQVQILRDWIDQGAAWPE